MGVVGEQNQRGQPGGADGVALGYGLGGVAYGVQWIGDVADLFGHLGHFGDAAGVVGDRPEGVQRNDHPGHRKHGRGGDRDTVQPRELVGEENAQAHRQHRQRGGLHRKAQPGDDVGGVAGRRRLGQFAYRRELRAGVVIGDQHDHAGKHQADQRTAEQACGRIRAGLGPHLLRQEPDSYRGEHGGHDHALVQRRHHALALACAHREGPDDGGHDRHGADGERVQHRRVGRLLNRQEAEQHRGDDGHGVGLEQVGGHSGAVAHVVAHVVGNNRRVAGVVLGDARLDLSDQVRAHVGALGENSAAQPREDRDQRAAEGQAHERMQHVARFHAGAVQHQVVAGHAQQGQAHHQHSGDRAAAEGHRQRRVHSVVGGLRGARIGPHRHVHADVAGRAGKRGAYEEPAGHRPIEHESQYQQQGQARQGDRHILPVQVGLGADLHRRGDLLHSLVAGIQLQHPARAHEPVENGQGPGGDGAVHVIHMICPKCAVGRLPANRRILSVSADSKMRAPIQPPALPG